MTAERGNKVYTIDESMKAQYQNDGYDIRDDNGEVIAYGAGKTVPYDEHMQAVKEVERLQRLCTDLQEEKTGLQKELETIKAEKKPASKRAGE
ncbi:MAG: hypothetical protein SOY85_24890 [Blautia sp.]|uniref:Uncharacterized protein n=1 Tax=Blautia producta TaxID=33035 RepID=A0A4P6M5D7_9FIRM|nr:MULTISPECIES: hypothetical protein [Blautia]MCB6725525.1 hypothetical protein [Blautia marasmi]MCQ5096114.1 hypothetical protein [Blautia producta]MDY4058100.1 hypothetical protein [Blautia sp.]QBE99999.1 hypothetical protein PMF13cell1_05595 [Blautia producta]